VHRVLGEQQENRDPDIAATPAPAAPTTPPVVAAGGKLSLRAGPESLGGPTAAASSAWATPRAGISPEVVVTAPVFGAVLEAVLAVTVFIHVSPFHSR